MGETVRPSRSYALLMASALALAVAMWAVPASAQILYGSLVGIVKDSTGGSKTLTATGGAVASLAKVKAGDWVMVTGTDTTASKIAVVKDTATKKK